MYLKRKVDLFLSKWKNDKNKMPLIIKGARQIGKTKAIKHFAENNYDYVVEINFALQSQYKNIFNDGYEVDNIIKNITLLNPNIKIVPNKTLIFFDELQNCTKCATSLKSFCIDKRYDVICSGSLMGINYNEIESNSVGYKQDYTMYSLDFEEYLWAKGYQDNIINEMLNCMINIKPLSDTMFDVISECFKEYMILGGMPKIVRTFIEQKNYSGLLNMQKQLILDYEEDITKYASGLEKTKILNVFRKIPVFLGKDNKKFQISKVSAGAKSRDYVGVNDWLQNAGMINICYDIQNLGLPLKGNYNPDIYKIYFADTGLMIACLDDESQEDLRINKNFNIYKGALFENIVGEMLVKQGYNLYFYRNEKGTIEMDFFVRDKDSLIPIEVKANDGATASLNKLLNQDKYKEIKYGIKLCNKNIGFNGKFYTFPYFLTFLIKRYLESKL